MSLAIAFLSHASGPHLDAYLLALAAAPEVSKVFYGDPSASTFELAKSKLGDKLVSTQRDYADALAHAKPDASTAAMALIAVEAVLAPPVIDAALEKGCHVMAEKPACVSARDFAPLVHKAEDKRLHLMLALANRVTPAIQKARALVATGELGKLYGMEIQLVADQARLKNPAIRESWMFNKGRGGGGNFTWLGIHWLDLAMYISHASIKQVTGFAGVVGGQPIDVEDSVAAALAFDNGTFGVMTCGYYLESGYQDSIRIWGERGWLHFGRELAAPLLWQTSGDKEVQKFTESNEPQGYGPFVRACARASLGLEQPPVSPRECLRLLNTIFAFYDAVKTGQAQRVAF